MSDAWLAWQPGSLANISHHVVTSESSESRESSGLAVLCLKPFMSGDSQGWPALPHVTDELDLSPLEHVPLSSLRSTFFSQRKTVNFILQQKLPSIFDFSKVQSNVNTYILTELEETSSPFRYYKFYTDQQKI